MHEETWNRWARWPLTCASVAFLALYSWRVISDAAQAYALWVNLLIAVTWAMFVLDYCVRLAIARERWRWFRTHLTDLAVTVMPVLRLTRLMRVFTTIASRRRSHAAELRAQIVFYGIGIVAILVYLASLLTLDVERDAPGASIVNFGDAIWWACATVTTTGYGDYTPVTVIGRLVGVCLMFGGLAIAGIVTATLASWVLERGARHDDSDHPATRRQVRELTARVDELVAALALARDPGANAAPSEAPDALADHDHADDQQ